MNQNWPDLHGYRSIISVVVTGITLIGFIYTCFQLCLLKTSLLVLQQVHDIHLKTTLPSFVVQPSTTTISNSICDAELLKNFHGYMVQ